VAKVTPFDVNDSGVADLGQTQREARKAFESLTNILLNLSFRDNFKSFYWEGTITASSEKKINHNLRRVPSGHLTLFSKGGVIQTGDTDWNTESVYIKETSGVDAIVRVVFFI